MKKLTKKVIHSLGYDLHRLNMNTKPEYQIFQSMKKFEIDLVLDIGANEGQFSSEIRSVGYKGQIFSFEPLSEAHKKITQTARRDKSWTVHPRCAIGDYDGNVEINISGNSFSSSVLPMTNAHSSVAKNSAYIGSEKVPIARLDSVAPKYISSTSRVFIKIDTQGFEWQVLDGASETLKNAQGVLCEMSLVPLYEGQYLWMDILKRLENEGFTLWALQRGFTDMNNGRTLQMDGLFFRTESNS
ncbi:MAG: FkbM family methyltransferase [Chloroflexota bacterium]|nr:FkbM family methyltransferase [Chloroflexota bacterium]